jgi:hypothetical protein
MKIRKCKVCGMPPNIYGVSGNPGLARFTCSYFLCNNNERYESLEEWNAANKPDKQKKVRNCAVCNNKPSSMFIQHGNEAARRVYYCSKCSPALKRRDQWNDDNKPDKVGSSEIRKCKLCGDNPAVISNNGILSVSCLNDLCVRCDMRFDVHKWNEINKPDKPSRKYREIARLTELVEMSKADLVKATEKIAELTREVAYHKAIVNTQHNDLAQCADKIGELAARSLGLSLEKVSFTKTIDAQEERIKKAYERVTELEEDKEKAFDE